VTEAATKLLVPHQYGVGVSSGAERILHSVQHALTDERGPKALLKIDISNAFNTCDRARVLRELYALPDLSQLYRIANFAYSAPSQLLLQGCRGESILSENGVRQGDPLSALLFCIYMRDVFTKVVEEANVEIYGFFDDINIVGNPAEVMKALTALQRLLPEVSLTCNTSKSHFAYFQDDSAPLMRHIRETLAHHNIEYHSEWVELVGAVVGKNEAAITTGLAAVLDADDGTVAFFRRLQLDELPTNDTMQLLRQCAVPKMTYLLRCTPPPCIDERADAFDHQVLNGAMDKLQLPPDQRDDSTLRRLRAKPSHGGHGLASARQTSPAAYLGSLAAVRDAPALAIYCDESHPLPASTMLHGWITGSMEALVSATPESADSLPATASSFFHHYASAPKSLSSSLQHTLSLQACSHAFEVSLSAAKEARKKGDARELAYLLAISAPRAQVWKTVLPTEPALALSDSHYRLAARLSLGLPPPRAAAMPDDCPLCNKANALKDDAWHLLSCTQGAQKAITQRHNEVVDAIYRTALAVGAIADKEPRGLHRDDNRRPDLQLFFPGRHVITDVVVSHPLTSGYVNNRIALRPLGVAKYRERLKHAKYDELAAQHGAQLLPFAVETLGGLAPDAQRLLTVIAQSGEEHLSLWAKDTISRHLQDTVAIAIQRSTARLFESLQSHVLRLEVGKQRKERKERGVDWVLEDSCGRDAQTIQHAD
jgi:hypothetical protein